MVQFSHGRRISKGLRLRFRREVCEEPTFLIERIAGSSSSAQACKNLCSSSVFRISSKRHSISFVSFSYCPSNDFFCFLKFSSLSISLVTWRLNRFLFLFSLFGQLSGKGIHKICRRLPTNNDVINLLINQTILIDLCTDTCTRTQSAAKHE